VHFMCSMPQHIDCILVIRHPDVCHLNDRKLLVKNSNMWLNIFINVHLLVHHTNMKHIWSHLRRLTKRYTTKYTSSRNNKSIS
jgi:hypothetical protein